MGRLTDPTIEVRDLTRRYGAVTAVDGISFTVGVGEVFALLGPNGAGKTTTVEILEGYRRADAGSVRVLGTDPRTAGRSWRDRIGIVLQQSGISPVLTVTETLIHLARLYSTPAPVDEVIERVGLAEKSGARISTLSGGQQRRVDLAAAIIGQPDLLFLDEPTTGFDPAARREAWAVVEALAGGGTSVLLTTHYLDEAQRLADRVAVISSGRIVAEGDPATLGGRDVARAQIRFRLPDGTTPPNMAGIEGSGGSYRLASDHPVPDLHALTGWALETGVDLTGLELHRPSLEDVYLELVGEATP